eukprot:81454-Rhodomonas_salina.3
MVQRSDCARPSHRAHDAAAFARRILGHKSAVVCAHCLRSTAQIAFDLIRGGNTTTSIRGQNPWTWRATGVSAMVTVLVYHSYVLCVGVDEWVVGVSITDRICGNGISERQRENASLTVLFKVAFVQVRCLQCWVEMYEVRSPLRPAANERCGHRVHDGAVHSFDLTDTPRLVVVGHFGMGANIDEHLLYLQRTPAIKLPNSRRRQFASETERAYAVAIIDERPNLDVAAHSDWGVGSVLVQKNVWHLAV